MIQTEPHREWQDQQHQRILQDDPTAFAQLCEQALPHLVSFLRAGFWQYEPHLHEATVIDCLLDYQRRPQRYDPHKLSLFGYLRMAVRHDMLNAIDKQRRREKRLFNIDDPTIQRQLPDEDTIQAEAELDEWLQEHTALLRQDILELLDAELSPVDKQVILLMMEGVRESRRYAELLEITHMEAVEQRRQVKRVKDRLTKKLRRFGQRIDKRDLPLTTCGKCRTLALRSEQIDRE